MTTEIDRYQNIEVPAAGLELKFTPGHVGVVAIHGLTVETDGARFDLWPSPDEQLFKTVSGDVVLYPPAMHVDVRPIHETDAKELLGTKKRVWPKADASIAAGAPAEKS